MNSNALRSSQKHVALDPMLRGCSKPLTWHPLPGLCRGLFDDALIDLHLDMLAAQQQPDGGWQTSWSAISPASELEARCVVTINTIKTLKAYDHLK